MKNMVLNKNKKPVKLLEVNKELTDTEKNRRIENSCNIIRHVFKCVILAFVLLIFLEKVSRKYKIFHSDVNYEEEPIESSLSTRMKRNLSFFCDQKTDIYANSTEAVLLLRNDIVNLKQLVVKVGEQLRERRRMECITRKELSRIEERVQKYLKETDTVDQKIKKALLIYESDKVGLFDYAASYAGGKILAVEDAIPVPTNKISQLLVFFKLAKDSTPNQILNPSCLPGECFTFFGDKAKFIIMLGKPVEVHSVSLEHSFLVEDISSAPREFQVFSMKNPNERPGEFLGNFTYDIQNKQSLQTFKIAKKNSPKCQFVMLNILNNHGHKETSIYRFRVHS